MKSPTKPAEAAAESDLLRVSVTIRGAVQGVGFRPFIYRLATGIGLTGWVSNSAQGVHIEAEGSRAALESFLLRIESERPPRASIQGLEYSYLDPVYHAGFSIRASERGGSKTAQIVPDIATCADCLGELFDPADRRHLYPFINCTNCGPRFSIIERLPYDRPHTTMKAFTMCTACESEYRAPLDRRFHAQPNACPECGPHLEWWDARGTRLAFRGDGLRAAADSVRRGEVVAIKGLGGFHLMVDARNADAVGRLRQRKHREEKPFAVMYPTLAAVAADCEVSPLEARLLQAAEAPIVLLSRRREVLAGSVVDGVAPANPRLGALLPYTPLHHILLRELGFPVVATSGNSSEEPICTDEHAVVDRLAGIADGFLVHDRPIMRHVDDSIARVLMGREMVLRRARGYAPLPIRLKRPSRSLLAVGAHLKNAVALAVNSDVYISQHIGDLDNQLSYDAFQRVIRDFQSLYEVAPESMACDLHPDYISTSYARARGIPVTGVQHHHAHVVACMAENQIDGPVLGVAWDGAGHGTDGTLWGGEFLLATETGFTRVASFRSFALPGGFKAIRQPRRTALGLLHEMMGRSLLDAPALAPLQAIDPHERSLLVTMLERKLLSPRTTSVGRLFDAVASIAGLVQVSRFEGQAAMALEFALLDTDTEVGNHYPVAIALSPCGSGEPRMILDWAPLVEAVLADVRAGVPAGRISGKFHNGLVESLVEVARRVGEPRVVLAGGCFQNAYLTERSVTRLAQAGFRPYWNQRIPPNDGGIALGQAVVAAHRQGEADDVQIR